MKLTSKDDFFYNEASLVNFVWIVFELGVKMLTLLFMENPNSWVKPNRQANEIYPEVAFFL